jgi:tetratricopeptide (TPR) repeat protein
VRGDPALAEERAVEATRLLMAGSAAWYRAIRQLSVAAGKVGAFARVEAWAAPAAAETPAPGAEGARIACLACCATDLVFAGLTAAADRLVAELAEALDDPARYAPQVVATLEQLRGVRAAYAGDFAACVVGFEAALAAHERAGDHRDACALRANLSVAYIELGDYAGAEEMLRAASAVAERMGLADVGLSVLQNLGHVLAYRRQLPEARRVELRALEGFRALGDPRMEGVARMYLAEIAYFSGDLEIAEQEGRAATAGLEVAPPLRAAALAVLARVLLALRRNDEALTIAREAHRILESLGGIEEGESLVRLVHAEALAASGDHAASAAALLGARDRLLARAGRISDAAWRARFLEGVRDNARTLSLTNQERRAS